MISEFKTIPKAVYYVQTADGCTVLDPDGDTLAEITAPGGYFPGIAASDGGPGTVTFSAPVKRVVGPFDLAPQLQLTILGQLGGNTGLPAGYKRVEYLESTGTQYMVLTAEMQLPLEVTIDGTFAKKIVDNGTSNYMYYGYTLNDARVRLCVNWGSSSVCCGVQAWLVAGISFPLDGKRHLAVMKRRNFEEKTELVVDGTKIEPLENKEIAGTWAPGVPYLFALNENNNPTSFCAAKIWGFSYKHGNAIDCNVIPCLDETGSPCMYDTVNKKAYYNQGTGDFLYPSESTTYSLRRTLPDWGKLTEHGLRRLYHAPANYKGELIDYAIENGFKPIVEPEKPEDGYWAPRWTETDEEIILEWVETEPPTDEFGLPMKEES